MKRFLLTAALLLALGVGASAVEIDLSEATVAITGPTTLHFQHVLAEDAYWWAVMEWNPDANTFEIVGYGPEQECPSVVGTWALWTDWWCEGQPDSTSITFYDGGRLRTGEGAHGEWRQSECHIEWLLDNDDSYWGVMDPGGDRMEGRYLSYMGVPGCWWAHRMGNGD